MHFTGLLAGLHEFPTAPNVPVTTKPDAQAAIGHSILSVLLASPPSAPQAAVPPRGSVRSSKTAVESDGAPRAPRRPRPKPSAASVDQNDNEDPHTDDELRMVKVVPAGDVLHVFSHIKKTYRIQWVVLEGGDDEPPQLVPDPDLAALDDAAAHSARNTTKPKPSSQKKKVKKGASVKPRDSGAPTTQWVQLDAVADAKYVLLCALSSLHPNTDGANGERASLHVDGPLQPGRHGIVSARVS